MKIQLSDHFTYGKLFRFTFPSIIMMVFTSIYSVVDGFFVSNFAGKTAFASINLIMPFLIILGSLGFMIGTGGTALVSRILGEGDEKKSKLLFFYADLAVTFDRYCSGYFRCCLYASCCCIVRRYKRDD